MPALPDDQLETLPAASAHPPGAPDDVDAANLPTSSSDGLESLEILREIARAPARQPAVMLSPGGRWGDGGRYVIERRLGRGGMGSVYAARDTVLDRRVALKLLDAAQRDDRDRVLREAKLAARVEHERIARVYDAGVHDGVGFVAMEFVDGVTLRQWMATTAGGAAEIPQVVDISLQVAEGLAALHGAGVVHRDLKPENVMLSPVGVVKLLDFGLARSESGATQSTAGRPALGGSAATHTAGTPGYMAPEQWAGQPCDARADVFALGIITYELLAGERPFRGTTVTEIGEATLAGTAAPPSARWLRAPERLREHNARMIERDPRARFADGAEAFAALSELESTPSLRSIHLPHLPTARRLSPPRPRGVTRLRAGLATPLGRAAAIAVIAGVGVAGVRAARCQSSAVPPPSGMVRIDGGTIQLGRPAAALDRECVDIGPDCDREAMRDEQVREVRVPAFYLDRDEVTNLQFATMLNDLRVDLRVVEDREHGFLRYVERLTPSGERVRLLDTRAAPHGASGIEIVSDSAYRALPELAQHPVVQVSWFGAALYCEAIGKRLPTEAEWEAAARSTDDRRFPWGDDPPRCGAVVLAEDGKVQPLRADCHPAERSGPVGGAVQDTSADGVHDLAGNVAEWTASPWITDPRPDAPIASASPVARVVRGGSWAYSLGARTSARTRQAPTVMATNFGFRCASSTSDSSP